MYNLTVSSTIDKWLAPDNDFDTEISQIAEFVQMSAVMREIAAYKIYYCYVNKTWLEKFSNGSDFIKYMGETVGVSSRILYDRLKVYDVLSWLGISPHDSITRMCDKPNLYSQSFQLLVKDWDLELHQAGQILIPDTLDMSESAVKEKMLTVLDAADGFEKQYEAVNHIKQDILGKPIVNIYVQDSDVIVIEYESSIIEPDGTHTPGECGLVKWYPNVDAPEWVLDALRRRIEKR